VVSPWVVRNELAFGEPLLFPTKGGRNLWEFNNQKFSSEFLWTEPRGVERFYARIREHSLPTLRRVDLVEFPVFGQESEPQRDRIITRRVIDFLKANPIVYAKLCAVRFLELFEITPGQFTSPARTVLSWLTFAPLLPLGLAGAVLALRRRHLPAVLLLFIIIANSCVHILTASGTPHRVPTDPYLILLSLYALTALPPLGRCGKRLFGAE
jgi:hypothetical protein